MGITFDKDSLLSINGPMLFFTNPEGGIELAENIRGAINSRLSLYAYRCPGDYTISFGISENFVDGIGTPGFVIAPFSPTSKPITIPFANSSAKQSDNSLRAFFPQRSSTKDEYVSEINRFKVILDSLGYGKIVAARVLVREISVDPLDIFSSLCKRYNDAFVFMFSTPVTGCWIGASPELLLSSKNGFLETMALAGTKESGIEREWDLKNIEEQQMVADYITDCLSIHNLMPAKEETTTVKAGNVEHLCTRIFANNNLSDSEQLSILLKDMAPTPALCGMPKETALNAISQNEQFERGCYGGYCGPFHGINDFRFNVSLRCSMIENNRIASFAGGGITMRSDPDEEWEETEMKLSTIADIIDEVS